MARGGCCERLVRVSALVVIRGGSDGRCERLVRSGLKAAQVNKPGCGPAAGVTGLLVSRFPTVVSSMPAFISEETVPVPHFSLYFLVFQILLTTVQVRLDGLEILEY